MVNNDAIINIINKLTLKNGAPCKKTLQKIVFLIEARRVTLGCDYGIHFYGPYSYDLDFAVRELCEEGILKIEYTAQEHTISVLGDYNSQYNNSIVDKTIDEFGKDSPSELELLATALYVYLKLKDTDKIHSGVVKIKGNKYTNQRISNAVSRLRASGYLSV